MCGIVGYAGRPGMVSVDLLTGMRDAIAHRFKAEIEEMYAVKKAV